MPVEVNFTTLDKALMARFWATRPAEERDNSAAMADRILVFHRGVTLVCPASTLYISLAACSMPA